MASQSASPLASSRRRLPVVLRGRSRAELAVTIVLVAAGAVAFTGPTALGLDSPKAAALAYLAAESRSDVAAVSAVSHIRTDLVGSAQASLLDERALKAAFANQAGRPSSIEISEPTVEGNSASAQATYRLADATRHVTLKLDRDFPALRLHGRWKVRVEPAFLSVSVPAAAGDLTVDGLTLHLPAGKPASIALFPGSHVLSTTGPGLEVGETVPYVAAAGPTSATKIALKLTRAGTAAAAAAVAAAFTACSEQAAPGPTGCPQTFGGFGPTTLTWSLIGDPYADAASKIDPTSGALQIFGHYRMIATADSGGRVTHRPSSGGYSLQLRPEGAAFVPGPITAAADLPLATRSPEATDQSMLDAVRAGIIRCAQATVADPPDCPQVIFADASNVSWSIQGDPMAGSAVAFDPEADSFVVAGRVTLHYRYDSSLLGIALHNDNSAEYPFTAHLFWDARQPKLVTIFGSTVR